MLITVEVDASAGERRKGFKVIKAEVKLTQVTRDGYLRVRILPTIQASDLVKNFNNESININLMNEEQEKVNFKIENRDTTKGEILLKLQF